MSDNVQEKSLDELLSELKPRERNFVFKLRSCGEQGKAARLAGYPEKSADVQASRMMKREDIQIIIKKLYEQDCKALCITSDSIIVKAYDMYNRCMQAEPVMQFNRTTGEYEATGEYQFDSKGAGKALEIIAKVAGLERKKLEFDGKPFDVNITVVE